MPRTQLAGNGAAYLHDYDGVEAFSHLFYKHTLRLYPAIIPRSSFRPQYIYIGSKKIAKKRVRVYNSSNERPNTP